MLDVIFKFVWGIAMALTLNSCAFLSSPAGQLTEKVAEDVVEDVIKAEAEKPAVPAIIK